MISFIFLVENKIFVTERPVFLRAAGDVDLYLISVESYFYF